MRLDDLTQVARRQVQDGIPADNRAEAEQILRNLQQPAEAALPSRPRHADADPVGQAAGRAAGDPGSHDHPSRSRRRPARATRGAGHL